ncbi:hypothetical protein [Chelatococcus reniformis]|uniref:Secreted protein n=1 Tax=Chelatococcus reniformis TaxID=1494448 RepID=A0A916U2L6_9HYPH|nr:hypothetical protein [Chelatococcus reniformis]GGC56441.1 hypothetical protein GCM10010994_14200 [Chelatococcus reniformis]
MGSHAIRAAFMATALAGVTSPLAAMPAAFMQRAETHLPLERAGVVCDANGCRAGSASTDGRSPYYGRSYLGGDGEVKRALADRDRLRRERQQRDSAAPAQTR